MSILRGFTPRCMVVTFHPAAHPPITNLLDRSRGNLNHCFSYVATLFPSSSVALSIRIYSGRAPFHWTASHYSTLLSSLHVVYDFLGAQAVSGHPACG